VAFGCSSHNSYFVEGSVKEKRVLRQLFKLLETEKGEARVTLIMEISDHLRKYGQREKQILFLTRHVETNPKDPYNSFYLALVAEAYEDLAAIPLAVHYYERILKNHPDIMVMGSDIHFHCLQKLLQYVDVKEYRVEYYKELLSRFSDYIDVGTNYYYLAKTYEELGAWDLSIQAYKRFLSYPNTKIPGHPDIFNEVAEKVALYDSSKSWTVPDLQVLVKEIQTALSTKNTAKLKQYKAGINFFSKYWGQKEFDPASLEYFNIYSWLLKSKVHYAKELESDSNAREAYLKTWNWLYHVDTWYFYFRRVDFPADPEIDGRWEWAGIYFGEKG
jgi:tetratricopeptide (TPR) repeat protein